MDFSIITNEFTKILLWIDQYRYPTPEVGDSMLLIVTPGLLLLVIGVWLKYRFVKPLILVAVTMTVPLMVAIFIAVSNAYVGGPDDNCHKYKNGQLVFTLITFERTRVNPSEPFSDEWLLLIVRAKERWGNESHMCRIPLESETSKYIWAQIQNQSDATGEVTFTFSGANVRGSEKSNVKWSPSHGRDQKPGPPEEPPMYDELPVIEIPVIEIPPEDFSDAEDG